MGLAADVVLMLLLEQGDFFPEHGEALVGLAQHLLLVRLFGLFAELSLELLLVATSARPSTGGKETRGALLRCAAGGALRSADVPLRAPSSASVRRRHRGRAPVSEQDMVDETTLNARGGGWPLRSLCACRARGRSSGGQYPLWPDGRRPYRNVPRPGHAGTCRPSDRAGRGRLG